MATAVAPLPQITSDRIEPEPRGWTSWITTTDHKRIGILYMVTTFVFFCLGGVEDACIYLIHLTGLSSILGAINLYVTIANMRARGMSWGRLPLFVWAILTYSVLIILAIPVIAAAVTMLLADRHFGTHFFDAANGGSALLWPHLFWFFGHPEVYF